MGKKDPRIDGYIKKAMELNEKGIKHPARSMPSKRLETAIEWKAEGKPRHWKYLR